MRGCFFGCFRLVPLLGLAACQTARPPGAPPAIPAVSPAAPAPTPALLTGAVVFDGLTEPQLADFRVIPEEGLALFTPRNQRYDAVDGFWWRPRRGEWFKIPGGVEVRVSFPPGAQGAPAFETQMLPTAEFYLRLKGPAAAPGWHRDVGATAHPTDDPF